jgi:hypothetical protein
MADRVLPAGGGRVEGKRNALNRLFPPPLVALAQLPKPKRKRRTRVNTIFSGGSKSSKERKTRRRAEK